MHQSYYPVKNRGKKIIINAKTMNEIIMVKHKQKFEIESEMSTTTEYIYYQSLYQRNKLVI